ncbi:MAG: MFS transporter [Myxococcales bacterium]|nr:MFS transporter [Myxococcales bacterium]
MRAPYERWLLTEGFLGEVFVTLTGGVFLTGLALLLGAGPVALALLSALPFLGQVGQLAAPPLERRLGSRRRFVVPAMIGARALWLVPTALAVVGLSGGATVTTATLVMLGIGLLGMVAINGWTAWVADLVPVAERARVFGRRAWAVALGTLITAPAGALLLDFLRKRGQEPLAFGVLGAVAVLAGVGGALTLRRVPDQPPHAPPRETPLAAARRLGAQPDFRRVLGLFTAWNIAIGLPAPFWALYMLDRLEMSFFLVTLHTVVVLLVRLPVNAAWSRVIERVGSRRVLIACGSSVALIPLIWLVPTPDLVWPLYLEAVFSGVIWTGFNQAAFIQPMAALDPPDRSFGLALFGVCTGAALFAAALAGGALLETMGAAEPSSFYVLFVTSSILRATTAVFALRLTEPGITMRAFFVSFVGNGVLRRPAGRVFVPVEVPPDENPSPDGVAPS